MAENSAVFDVCRTLTDRDRIDDLAAWLTFGCRRLATSHDPAAAQVRDEFALQNATSLDEQTLVDRLMRHLHHPVMAVLDFQPPRYLLW